MSRNINNFTPFPGAHQPGVRAYDHHTPNDSDFHEVPVFYRSLSSQATPEDDRRSGELNPRWVLEDRTHSGLYRIPDFPVQSHLSFVLNGGMGRGFNPRLREISQQSVPRSTNQTNLQVATGTENSRSTAMSKLKKEVYDPTRKLLARRVRSYYIDHGGNALKQREKEKEDEDGKRCAICLEDFEPKQEVMVTPCKHMFRVTNKREFS